jgi:uncharacterized repeat protein (TIGR03803 family)
LQEYAPWTEKRGRDEVLYRFRLTEFPPTKRLTPGAMSAKEIPVRFNKFANLASVAALLALSGYSTAETASGAPTATTETVLYSFAGGSNGTFPQGALASDAEGNLFGATGGGGAYDYGTVFELSPNTSGGWTQSVLYSFTGGSDGGGPSAGVIASSSGSLYGTTVKGGANGFGTVFELAPSSGGGWVFNTIHTFSGSDGATSYTPVTFDAAGNLYGTTRTGGTHGYGVVFEMKQNADGVWNEAVIYSFTGGKDEGFPMSGVVFDSSGNLYGTNVGVAEDAPGVVFELSRQPRGNWKIDVLPEVGLYPIGTPILDPAGNLYGTTYQGGYGYGNIYELQPESDGRWKGENLWYFSGSGADGIYPYSSLVRDTEGNLYGVTPSGGLTGNGVAYKLSRQGRGWQESVMYNFSGGADGSLPTTLVGGLASSFYGITEFGGAYGEGTVFEITP